jgi:hypothetical protein
MQTRSGMTTAGRIERSVAPLGKNVKLHANSPVLLDCVLPFYPFAGADSEEDAHRVAFFAGPDAYPLSSPVIRVEEKNIFLAANGISARADASARAGICEIARGWFEEPERLAAEVIDPLLLFLLSHDGRIPVHASAFLLGHRAIVLAGHSGSGKSTLALAALRAGLAVLSDDIIHVQLDPYFAVWALPRPLHVFAADAPPDTAGAMRLRSGKWKAVIERRTGDPCVARRTVLCLLEPSSHASLERIDPERAVRAVSEQVEPGFDLFRNELPRALRAVGAEGTWRLGLSRNPDEALAILIAQFGGS